MRDDRTGPAFGFPRDACIPTMQDKPVMRAFLELLRYTHFQQMFNFIRCFFNSHTCPVGYPEDMGVHRDSRLAESFIDHNISGLPSNTGKGFKDITIFRHIAPWSRIKISAAAITFLALVL